jgi:aromatic ring hydroxylase
VDTLLVLPTKAMHADEPEYAIACAVDVNATGVSTIARLPRPSRR